jgi:hypothetical protein
MQEAALGSAAMIFFWKQLCNRFQPRRFPKRVASTWEKNPGSEDPGYSNWTGDMDLL